MTVPERTDEALMLDVGRGELQNLSLLFERHYRTLFNFFLRLTGDRPASEDLVQDVFFRILKYRNTYRVGIPFERWMYRIARNARLDQVRKRRGEERLDEHAAEQESRDPVPGETLAQNEELALLRGALTRLPEDKREVLLLSRFQELKNEEIAQILEVNVGAVKVRIYRALRELKKAFEEISAERSL